MIIFQELLHIAKEMEETARTKYSNLVQKHCPILWTRFANGKVFEPRPKKYPDFFWTRFVNSKVFGQLYIRYVKKKQCSIPILVSSNCNFFESDEEKAQVLDNHFSRN